MLVDVTQNLQVRITPVNNPAKGDGFYRAVISHDYHALIQSQHITSAGKVPENVGYAEHISALIAATDALADYERKFGTLCVHNTDNEYKE